MAPLEGLKACGIEDSSAMVEWFWDNQVAAVGTDCPAVEPWPWDFKNEGALHYRTLSLLGLPLGEQFNLEELAADCAAGQALRMHAGVGADEPRRRHRLAAQRGGNKVGGEGPARADSSG